MVENNNVKLLVSFGNYLLSEERTNLIKNNPGYPDELLLKERLSVVHDADLQNFKTKIASERSLDCFLSGLFTSKELQEIFNNVG